MSRVWLRLKSTDGVHHRVVSSNTRIEDLRAELLEDHSDWDQSFKLFYRGRQLRDNETLHDAVDATDADPTFEVRFDESDDEDEETDSSLESSLEDSVEEDSAEEDETQSQERSVLVKLGSDVYSTRAQTMGELRSFVNHLAKSRNEMVIGILLQNESVMSFGSDVLVEDILDGADERVFVAVLGPQTGNYQTKAAVNLQRETLDNKGAALLEAIFDAQAERDRIHHINQMAFNSKLVSSSLLSLGALVEARYPELQAELLRVIKLNHDATELMHQALAEHAVFRNDREWSNEASIPLYASPRSNNRATLTATSSPQRRAAAVVANANQAQPAAAAAPAAAQRANNNNINGRGGLGAGIAARVPRVRAMLIIDVRLLFKLGIIVAVLGHDAGQREFYFILLVAFIVYLANTNMLRIPFLDRFTQGGMGRIPRAERRGFFLDMWAMISSFFLSVVPTWRVLPEDPPADADQIRPVEAHQPGLAAAPLG